MPWGRGGIAKIVGGPIKGVVERSALKLAQGTNKEDFLSQLENAWYPHIRKHSDIESEVIKAQKRIRESGPFRKAFDSLAITDEDLRGVIAKVQDLKLEGEGEPIRVEKVGRNEPCPCGSGKKYKKCCGR